jgi:putative aldouronate transport system substrate-binding protein
MKKGLIVLLSIILSLTLFSNGAGDKGSTGSLDGIGFNETGFPIVDTPTPLSVFFTQNPEQSIPFNDMAIVKNVTATTNVPIEWVTAMSADARQKVNLLFASGDLPDVFLDGLNMDLAYNYGSQGLLRSMDDLIPKYAPTIKGMIDGSVTLKQTITAPDGNIYNLFRVGNAYHQDMGNMFYINRDWLKAVGMEKPTTTDEFYEVLKAFKGKDLNGNGEDDEIPFGICFWRKNANWSDLPIFGAFGVMMDPNTNFIYVDNGKVAWGPTSEGFKKGIEYLSKLYKEGLIDEEAYIHDKAQMQAKGNQQPPIYGAYASWFNMNVAGANGKYYDILGPLEGPEGYDYPFYTPRALQNANGSAITTDCEYPEVAMRWIDYIYNPEINIQMAYGIEGEALKKYDDGRWEILDPPNGESAEMYRMKYSPHHPPMTYPQYLDVILPAHFVEKDKAKKELYLPKVPEGMALPVFYLSAEKQEIVDSILPDLMTLADQNWGSWVMNGNIDEQWDAYIKQIDNMGLKKVLDVYQAEYDALKTK